MKHKCLFCYQALSDTSQDYHEKCSLAFYGTKIPPILDYTFSQMEDLALQIVKTSIAIPGVQPKLSLGMFKNSLEDRQLGRLTILEALDGNYILKPPNKPFPQMPENEHLTMKLAELIKINTVPHNLIKLKSGELSYITKRIDRKAGVKVHMLDMFQILGSYNKYKSSMERVGKIVLKYSQNTLLDSYRLFQLTIFCYLTGNNDMHLKNFSMINSKGKWILAPAYDLLNVYIHIPSDLEELALTLNGKHLKLKKLDFIYFGQTLGLNDKQINGVFKQFDKMQKQINNLILNSFLNTKNQNIYIELFNKRLKVIV